MNLLTKDLTTVKTGIVAHGCNCSGGFGSGIAGAIRRTWPAVAVGFANNGAGRELLGTIDVIIVDNSIEVINCYTQEFYGPGDKKYADLEAVEQCVTQVCEYAEFTGQDVYIAKIGCGLGGLSWEDEVKPLYEKIFKEYQTIDVYVCDIA